MVAWSDDEKINCGYRSNRERIVTPVPAYRADDSENGAVVDEALREILSKELSAAFKGTLIGPDSTDYSRACHVWNAMVDKRPGLIARCTCVSDVVAVVNAARCHNLAPSIRGGGHSVSGKALSDGGLTIDMSGMRNVKVDAARRLVHVDGGCLLGDVDAATADFGLVVPAGIVSETGVPGLALGGGVGWLSRKHGLTCDNFESLEIVLASGEVVEASLTSHPDLFWALKGGGGNFGVVTRFTFRAHPFGPLIRVGVALYRQDAAKEALKEYARVMPTLPRNVGWHGALKHDMPALPFVPPELIGERLVMLFCMWLGDANDPAGLETIERLTRTGDPCFRTVTVMPFALGMQRALDHEFADGHRNYTKEAHFASLPDEVIDILIDFWSTMPMHGETELIALGGAIGDVPEEGAAFSNRQHLWWLNFAMHWDAAADDDEHIGRTRAVLKSLEPWTGKGVYLNMLNFDEMHRVVEAFGGADKYRKLGRIKSRYDPQNLFRINYNITPVFE
jgi:FAD/FMN-containing dehydrogenase